ncbi:MAG: flagellar basal body P-ring protein FlgI [Gemmatimonadales bacterium]|nr:MAG: flagellar basal body P-ring protein FlgI [Gemmatimonadales bacterium]
MSPSLRNHACGAPSGPTAGSALHRTLPLVAWAALVLLPAILFPGTLRGQGQGQGQGQGPVVTVGDLTLVESEVPLRLMGYGLVVGLDGTGDRILGGASGGGFTVRSVANLLRRFDVEVPEEVLRTRNVAAVLVTAEASPWLRPGGRFTVQVSSLGDATSLRGGVLWATPLVADPGGPALAAAQGPVSVASTTGSRFAGRYSGETSAQIPDGGVVEVESSRTGAMEAMRLLLRQPDLGSAERIAEAVNAAFGDGVAAVEDPGSVRILAVGGEAPSLHELRSLEVIRNRRPSILVDSRSGTVVAGGGIRIGEAVISHEGITLTVMPEGAAGVAGAGADLGAPGELRLVEGASVQEVASALHAVGASARDIAAILRGLREIGALQAEVVVR